MRKIKLFMMLALLVVGVSGAWGATQNFTVQYSGRTVTQGAGYTANTDYTITFTSGSRTYTAGNIQSGYTSTSFTVSGDYADYPSYYRSQLPGLITPKAIDGYTSAVTISNNTITITYTERYMSYRMIFDKEMLPGAGYTVNANVKGTIVVSDDNAMVITIDKQAAGAPSELTNDNISNYITANAVTDYTTSLYVNPAEAELGYKGNITVNYVTSATQTDENTWNDGVFEYSRIYTRQSYNSVLLPEDEVAISLYMGDTEWVTDTVNYSSRLKYAGTNTNIPQGSSAELPDDDGDSVGETATFTYLGNHTDGFSGGTYFYTRRHQVACSKQTNITIPATVSHNGQTYKVTAIQKWGFVYKQNHQMMISYCSNPSATNPSIDDDAFWGCIDDHSNRYLQTVRFASPSNIKSIGDYAFMSCTKLTSIVFPNSLEYLGQGIFEMCYRLSDCRFQTLDDGTVKFKILKMFTFWMCTGLKSLELPDGITEIEGQQAGAALQYMLQLTNIRLPNTLERIGPHFLCCASSLQTLTIPASVTYIDGAAFHGCESLTNVYLLGSAAALQAEYTGSQSASTFDSNTTFCKDAVGDCTFWVTDDYYDSYKNDAVWSEIDETVFNEDFTEVISQTGNHNALRKIIQEKRTFPAKWVTAIFPYGVENYKTAFPANGTTETRVAVMDPDAEHTVTTGTVGGKSVLLYNIVFKLLEGDDIPAQTPVMICAAKQTDYVMYTKNQAATDWFKDQAPREHPTMVTAKDGATITMKGKYIPYTMHPWDFYFMYKSEDASDPAKFYRVPDADNAATVGACRCYWTINVENVKSNGQLVNNSKSFSGFDPFDDGGATGINNAERIIVIDGIYDMQGRKLDIKESELPQGLYIVNGKKVVKK